MVWQATLIMLYMLSSDKTANLNATKNIFEYGGYFVQSVIISHFESLYSGNSSMVS